MFLDLLYPRRCLGCGRPGQYFCPSCLKKIKPVPFQVCPVCEKPAISGHIHQHCRSCYALDGLVSVFPYSGIMKAAISRLKYRFTTDLVGELMELVIPYIPPFISNFSVLVPVPLHPRRYRWRGFNQSEVLGRLIAEQLEIKFRVDILRRKKATRPQVELREERRRKNIADAFSLSPNIQISQYPNILLFDDVWTTGATLKECGRVLKKAGEKTVWGLTLAR